MSYTKIWIHAVWSTKHRLPLLVPPKLDMMCQHICANAKEKGIYIDRIDGYDDHVHVLMLLKDDLSILKQIQLLKGESSHWANTSGFTDSTFAWANKYFAASVSGRKVPSVRHYIEGQKVHHQTQSFVEEFEHFLKSVGYSAQG